MYSPYREIGYHRNIVHDLPYIGNLVRRTQSYKEVTDPDGLLPIVVSDRRLSLAMLASATGDKDLLSLHERQNRG